MLISKTRQMVPLLSALAWSGWHMQEPFLQSLPSTKFQLPFLLITIRVRKRLWCLLRAHTFPASCPHSLLDSFPSSGDQRGGFHTLRMAILTVKQAVFPSLNSTKWNASLIPKLPAVYTWTVTVLKASYINTSLPSSTLSASPGPN